jgi:ABC-type transport system involved in multi-copper enzyme maturation permease subunit
MFKLLFIKEIQNYLYTIRFQVSFVIVLLVFIIGSISYVNSIREEQESYSKYLQERSKILEYICSDATDYAVKKNSYVISPRENTLISDCKEQFLPNRFRYSAYYVFDFSVRLHSVNPLMKQTQALNWAFIVSIILSFVALLLSFDSISGEKEDHTLILCLSNAVSRSALLLVKFTSIITVIAFLLIIGIITSLLIVSFSGVTGLDLNLLGEVSGFIGISLLFIAVMTVLGILSSLLTNNSNVSLLISLCIWLSFVVVIPNTSIFWADKLYPIASINP